MRGIDGYVMRTVGGAMFLVMVVVLSLDVIFAFIAELEDTRNEYQTLQALWYVALTLPRRIYDYLPLGAFMGCLVGLGSMASSSELTVIRAAGVSLKRIVWSAMKPALVVVILGVLIGEYVAPPAERVAQSDKAVALGATACLIGRPQLWGVAVAGEAGVAHVLDIYARELDIAMGLCGAKSLAEITPELLAAGG